MLQCSIDRSFATEVHRLHNKRDHDFGRSVVPAHGVAESQPGVQNGCKTRAKLHRHGIFRNLALGARNVCTKPADVGGCVFDSS